MSATILWFRQDLRLRDNPALAAALKRGGPIIPVYIWDEAGEGDWPAGAASRWWLHHSLSCLDASLKMRGSRLVLARGESGPVLSKLLEVTGATAVYWNRRYEPVLAKRDTALKAELDDSGGGALSFNASVLFEPDLVRNKSGAPFQVFTPFWRYCLSREVEPPVRLAGGRFPRPARWPDSLKLDSLRLLPSKKWDDGFYRHWQPGETGARRCLDRFVSRRMDNYAAGRNFPGSHGTSALSPHLHFGEIGPRQVWAAVWARAKDSGVFPSSRGAQVFLAEIGWREFAYHLLFNFPQTPKKPLRPVFSSFPWRTDAGQLRAWQQGRTGYPIVDAGMRQLWQTGWMHNRVRMIVASFLVKHLRISWREGAAWFWDTLVDADLASNTLGWQWSAGCGADAAPYFRIFNPMLQSPKFDPAGGYLRAWIPELAAMPAKFIHEPWTAPAEVLVEAGVELGRNYPLPIVEHGAARVAALLAFKGLGRKQP
jgi:deoxyribodipyrimidine photo-lyase